MARAYVVTGDEENYLMYRGKAEKAGEEIENKGNRDYFMGELRSRPNPLPFYFVFLGHSSQYLRGSFIPP